VAGMSIKASKKPSMSISPAPEHANFVLGSRPAVLRANAMGRITPTKATNTRDYGKAPGVFGSGNTGQTGET
jgi:hypothetical protein